MPISRICAHCGKTFKTVPSRLKHGRGKYCCAKCGHDARITQLSKTCRACQKTFVVQRSFAKQEFCSKPCWYNWHTGENNKQFDRIETTCFVCNKPIKLNRWRFENYEFHYCSLKCTGIHRRTWMAGPKHPLWTGGGSRDRGQNWTSIRKKIRERDNFKCTHCGMTEAEHIQKYKRRLTVHHKEPYRLNQDNSSYNLIALCLPCHRRIENKLIKNLTPLEKLLMATRPRKH